MPAPVLCCAGPSYFPINAFIRQLARVTDEYRKQFCRNPSTTFAATVRNICSGIRKLAAVATPEEASRPLWRGVRGVLPEGFLTADAQGLVVAVDQAFMSTSLTRETPIEYMGDGHNVLWNLQPRPESDVGFHIGADIQMLSQFASEAEVLVRPRLNLSLHRCIDTVTRAITHSMTHAVALHVALRLPLRGVTPAITWRYTWRYTLRYTCHDGGFESQPGRLCNCPL